MIEYIGDQKHDLGVVEGSKPLQGQKISIQARVSDIQKFVKALPFVQKWNIEQISSNNCSLSTILQNISHVQFIQLTYLDIRFNKIVSIQPISQIWMPNLKTLRIDENHIRSLKPMRKMSQSLQYLSMSNNYITSLHYLGQTLFQLRQIAIQYIPDHHMSLSVKDLVKLRHNKMQTIRVLCKSRISQYAAIRALEDKYEGLDFRKKNFDLLQIKQMGNQVKAQIRRQYKSDTQCLYLNQSARLSFPVLQSRNWQMLKQLWLRDCLLGDEKIKTIALMNWPNLEQLHISYNRISASGLQCLMKNPFPMLQLLDLNYNQFGDEGLKYVQKKSLLKIKFLMLQRTTITGFGLARLPNYNFSTLTYLQLNQNPIGTVGSQYLSKSDLPLLKTLGLRLQNRSIRYQSLSKSNFKGLQQFIIGSYSDGDFMINLNGLDQLSKCHWKSLSWIEISQSNIDFVALMLLVLIKWKIDNKKNECINIVYQPNQFRKLYQKIRQIKHFR